MAVGSEAPQLPTSKILAVGSFLAGKVHTVGDSVESKIETTYERKITSTERCEVPKEIPGAAMATAKAAYMASQGFSKAAGTAAKVIDGVAESVGAKAAKKGNPGAIGRCVLAANEVQEAVTQRASSVVAKAASCHVEYQEHTMGPEAAQLSTYIGSTAKNVTSGYLNAQKVIHPTNGLAKGVVKKAVVNKLVGK